MNHEKTIFLYDDNIGHVKYVDHVGDDKRIVSSARVSFDKDDDSPLNDRDVKLIKYLMKNKHTSVFEHCILTFKFVVPLFVRSQHHRHRTWSFNEKSFRYSSDNVQFYLPSSFRTQHPKDRQASNGDAINPIYNSWEANTYIQTCFDKLQEHNSDCIELYNSFLKLGICREQARMALPVSTYTSYYGTVNLNNLLKFITLRDSEHAQWEIQVVARACKEIAKDLFPETIKAFDEIRKQGENNDI